MFRTDRVQRTPHDIGSTVRVLCCQVIGHRHQQDIASADL
jgi:hypothetical protein